MKKEKLKIGIDVRLINQTGVGVYIKNLIQNLYKLAPANVVFHLYALGSDVDLLQNIYKKAIVRPSNNSWHSFSEQVAFLNIINKDCLDLMHFTYFSYPILYKRPFVITIHDTTPLLFKTGRATTKNRLFYSFKHLAYKLVVRTGISNSKAIITPTKTIKKQLISVYGKRYSQKIKSIYEGLDSEFLKIKENSDLSKQFTSDFFLYVGNFYPHKNIGRIITTFLKINCNKLLILAGPSGFFSDRTKKVINKLHGSSKVKVFTDPRRQDLVWFYKNAKALIHPSFSEGFGLTLLEATHFNCPIIASDIPVFKEILGSSYLSFNPKEASDIKDKIESFINNPKLAQINRNKILNKFSFTDMAKQTLNLYLNLV